MAANIRQMEIKSLIIQFLSLKYQLNKRTSPIKKDIKSLSRILISLTVMITMESFYNLNKNNN